LDSELDRLFEAAKAADEAFRRHRLSKYEVGYEGGGTIGESTTDAARREWSERYELLSEESRRAHEAWRTYPDDRLERGTVGRS
jgi:hypothetical protein